jgi:hypothetical protein
MGRRKLRGSGIESGRTKEEIERDEKAKEQR